ncbi:MAG TPA: hypothetical protein VGN26_13785 [Armatimonadota bacterium]|jgi:hypothetical protein
MEWYHQEYLSPCGDVRLVYDSPDTPEGRAELAWMVNSAAHSHEGTCPKCRALCAEERARRLESRKAVRDLFCPPAGDS